MTDKYSSFYTNVSMLSRIYIQDKCPYGPNHELYYLSAHGCLPGTLYMVYLQYNYWKYMYKTHACPTNSILTSVLPSSVASQNGMSPFQSPSLPHIRWELSDPVSVNPSSQEYVATEPAVVPLKHTLPLGIERHDEFVWLSVAPSSPSWQAIRNN